MAGWIDRALIQMKVNTKNIWTKSQINTLPVGWGITKIHIKIHFKWQIILEKSFFPKDKYFTKPDVKTSVPLIDALEEKICSDI